MANSFFEYRTIISDPPLAPLPLRQSDSMSPAVRPVQRTRIVALWAFCEAGLGGLLHALGSPLTGLFVGGAAVVLIALLAYHSDRPLVDLPAALLVVLGVKLAAAPHSPPMAYVAVAFQGLAAAVLFRFVAFRGAALLLGVLALVESAVQKLLVWWLLFGNELWASVDVFVASVGQKIGTPTTAAGSTYLVVLYVGTYFVGGLLVGWFAGVFPDRLARVEVAPVVLPPKIPPREPQDPPRTTAPWRRWLPALLLVGLLASYRFAHLGAVLLRVGVVLLLWYAVLAPGLVWLLRRRTAGRAPEIRSILRTLPALKHEAVVAWQCTSDSGRWRRLPRFLLAFVARVVYTPSASVPLRHRPEATASSASS